MLALANHWLARLHGKRCRSSHGPPSTRTLLRLERLEDRCVPANLYVTSSADDANQQGTLRYELAHANAGDSILIEVSSIVLTQGELVVNTKDLSISPLLTPQNPNARVAISGGNHSRVFEFAFTAGAPQIYNLDITGGNGLSANASGTDAYRDGQGGAILNEANLTVYNCTFTKNSAQEGGGIYNYYASARVWYCKLWGNSASQDGGALYNRGVPFPGWGWDFPPSGTMEVVGSKFYSNGAGGDGGAICNWVRAPNEQNRNFRGCVFRCVR